MKERDTITVRDETGNEKELAVEALFDMEDQMYVLLTTADESDPILMRLEEDGGHQDLVGISESEEKDAILSAYEIAVEANPAE